MSKPEEHIKTKDDAFSMIIALAYGYDGFNEVDSLKELIDELAAIASIGIGKTV